MELSETEQRYADRVKAEQIEREITRLSRYLDALEDEIVSVATKTSQIKQLFAY